MLQSMPRSMTSIPSTADERPRRAADGAAACLRADGQRPHGADCLIPRQLLSELGRSPEFDPQSLAEQPRLEAARAIDSVLVAACWISSLTPSTTAAARLPEKTAPSAVTRYLFDVIACKGSKGSLGIGVLCSDRSASVRGESE